MELSHSFGLLAGIFALISYGIFLKEIIATRAAPNPFSWAIWVFVGMLNAFTYWSVTGQDAWQSLIAVVVVFSMFVIFLYSLFKGQIVRISSIEFLVLALSVAIGGFWQLSSNDRIANLLLQGIYLVSLIPTFSALLNGRAGGYKLVWTVGIFAYFFSVLSIAFDPYSDWVAFIHPAVNALIFNALVFVAVFSGKESPATEVYQTVNYLETEVE